LQAVSLPVRAIDELTVQLQAYGLTKNEARVLVFLAKTGPAKASAAARSLRMNRTETYRTLRNLQKRGLVEGTLEHPVRFQAVAFDRCIDLLLEAKKAEAHELEDRGSRLKSRFKELVISPEIPALERFQVLEGKSRVDQRLHDMFLNARGGIAAVLTPADLSRADSLGLLDILREKQQGGVKVRIISEITMTNARLAENLRDGVDVRHLDLTKRPIPRVSFVGEEEALLAITAPDEHSGSVGGEEVALWIASRSFVRNLKAYFQEVWDAATPINARLEALKMGFEAEEIRILKGRREVRGKIGEMMAHSEKYVDIWTTEKGVEIIAGQRLGLLKELRNRNVRVRVIAPITKDNIEGARRLAASVELRHSEALGPARVMIVDSRELMLYERVPDDNNLEEGGDVGFWTTSVPFIETMARVYDALWKGTLGIYPRRRGLRMVGKASTA
jgi:sugar-specific transcriptional regulator TrmB